MKNLVRILSLLLVFLMLATTAVVFVACDDDDEGSTLINSDYDANGLIMDNLGTDLNFGHEAVYVMGWSDGYGTEFEQETITGISDIDAVYERNVQIESRLSVDLKFTLIPGSSPKRGEYTNKVESIYQNGGADIDIIATYTRTAGMVAERAMLMDLKKLGLDEGKNHLDFDMPWWPQEMLDTLSFGDSCYFLTGDASTSVLYMMTAIFVNKQFFNRVFNNEAQQKGYETGMEMLYQQVIDKEWTIDEMIRYTTTEGVFNDATGNGKTVDDSFGFATHLVHVDGFYSGANLKLVDQVEDDRLLVISPDFGSKKTVRLITDLGKWFVHETNYSERWDNEFGLDADGVNGHMMPFQKGRGLFLMARAYVAREVLAQKVTFQYGVLPIPMYKNDTYDQKNYYTVMGNPMTIFGIFKGCTNTGLDSAKNTNLKERVEMLTAVLECWGSEGYRRTTPEVFYVNMMTRYAESPEDALMFQYVRNGITFDLGRIFGDALSMMSELPSKCAMSNSSWSISYGSYKNKLDKQMEELTNSFKNQGTNAG